VATAAHRPSDPRRVRPLQRLGRAGRPPSGWAARQAQWRSPPQSRRAPRNLRCGWSGVAL